jgi:hypothetical protein
MKEACSILEQSCSTQFDDASQITHVRIELLVRRTLDASLAAGVDPRGWSKACPEYFLSSYLVDEREGEPLVRGGVAVRAITQPTLGQSWSGYLFEDVAAALGMTTWRVQNILRIVFKAFPEGRPTIRMDFALHECLHSQLGVSAIDGGVDIDAGFLEISEYRERPGTLRVTATKSLRYTPRHDWGLLGSFTTHAMNYTAPAVLGRWMNALVVNAMRA